jgi:pheromone shutdown protein TraB
MSKSADNVFDKAHKTHKGIRYILGVGASVSVLLAVIYTALTIQALDEVHDEGSNSNNTQDTSLTDKEQKYQRYNRSAMYSYIFSFILIFAYIAMKV